MAYYAQTFLLRSLTYYKYRKTSLRIRSNNIYKLRPIVLLSYVLKMS